MTPSIFIHAYNCVSPLGMDTSSNWQALLENKTAIHLHTFASTLTRMHASLFNTEALKQWAEKAGAPSSFTRLEQMIFCALQPLIEKYSISEKTLLVLSTTKGNITALQGQTSIPKSAYLGQLAQKIADYFGFSTKPIVVSNACVSGIMAISVAKNMLQAGLYKDAFVIAGDEIADFIVSGFNSFQAISKEICRPYDKNRQGINLGEAAAAAYLNQAAPINEAFEICGESAINDANHISGPSRTGEGLYQSVHNALKEALLDVSAIDFVSAHGTATIYNDDMESIAFNRIGLQNTPLHSLKGFYGHCLGASGLLEIIIAMEAAKHNVLIPNRNFEEAGTTESLQIIQRLKNQPIQYLLKTGSGFGGCNAAIILKKVNHHV